MEESDLHVATSAAVPAALVFVLTAPVSPSPEAAKVTDVPPVVGWFARTLTPMSDTTLWLIAKEAVPAANPLQVVIATTCASANRREALAAPPLINRAVRQESAIHKVTSAAVPPNRLRIDGLAGLADPQPSMVTDTPPVAARLVGVTELLTTRSKDAAREMVCRDFQPVATRLSWEDPTPAQAKPRRELDETQTVAAAAVAPWRRQRDPELGPPVAMPTPSTVTLIPLVVNTF
jgi:hypothetical protein